MNREIEFRAKRKGNNEWEHGFYYCQKGLNEHYIFPIVETPLYNGIPIITSFVEVKEETLGQYTGLKDKNGTKIFEGDIVRYEYEPDEYITGIMEYTCCGFHICTNADIYDFDEYCSLEVIGNIYDNPELLQQTE